MNVPQLRFKEFSDEWKQKKLGDVANKITDGTHDTPKPIPEGIPYLTAIHIKDGNIDYDNCYFLSEEEHKKIYKRCNPEKGDLLIVNIGAGTATCAINTVDYEFSLKNVALIKPNKELIYPEYLVQIQRKNSLKQFNQLTSGGAQPFLSLNEIGKIKVSFPSLPEQTKIASFLTAVDEKIAQLTQKADLLALYKKGVMQQIFSQQLRFQDDDGREFPEWEEKCVGDVFQVTRGNVLSMMLVSDKQTDEKRYPVFSSQTKSNGLSGYYSDYLYENCITWTTDGANAGDVNYRNGKFYCTNVCGVLKSDKGFANACIAAMINAVSKNHVSYVGNPKLMNNVMAKIRIKFPCLAEQTKIANFLTALDEKISHNQTQLNALKRYKQGLLQQLFV